MTAAICYRCRAHHATKTADGLTLCDGCYYFSTVACTNCARRVLADRVTRIPKETKKGQSYSLLCQDCAAKEALHA